MGVWRCKRIKRLHSGVVNKYSKEILVRYVQVKGLNIFQDIWKLISEQQVGNGEKWAKSRFFQRCLLKYTILAIFELKRLDNTGWLNVSVKIGTFPLLHWQNVPQVDIFTIWQMFGLLQMFLSARSHFYQSWQNIAQRTTENSLKVREFHQNSLKERKFLLAKLNFHLRRLSHECFYP